MREAVLGKFVEDYYRERNSQHFYVQLIGFISFRTTGDELILDELYIAPEHRKGFTVKNFVDEWIKSVRTTETTLIAFTSVDTPRGVRLDGMYKYYGLREDPTHDQANWIKYVKDLK